MKTSMTRKQWLLSGFVAFTCLASTARRRGPDRELHSGHRAASGKSGTRQLDALSAHL